MSTTIQDIKVREHQLNRGNLGRRDVPFSVFVEEICCDHQWVNNVGGYGLICSSCSSKCVKDDEGRIISYTRPAPGMDRQGDR